MSPDRPLGQLDEAFAQQLQPGDRVLLDGRCLEVRSAEGEAVLVAEVPGRPRVPRWVGEGWALSPELAGRLYLLRVRAAEALREGPVALARLLRREYALRAPASDALVAYFQRQECVSEIPDATTCLVEIVGADAGPCYYVHTPLGRRGNDALARVVVRRRARACGRLVTSLVADLGFQFLAEGQPEMGPEELRELFAERDFDADLDAAVADSAALRERFRRVAFTGLMLLRRPLGGRRRVGGLDWAGRRLLGQVAGAEPDFVLLRQARREVRDEACDADAARAYVEGLTNRTIRCRRLAGPSPFAEGWTQTAPGPVETVEGPADALRRLRATLAGAVDAG
jgi:ATP-dependent Lhr-like helicase